MNQLLMEAIKWRPKDIYKHVCISCAQSTVLTHIHPHTPLYFINIIIIIRNLVYSISSDAVVQALSDSNLFCASWTPPPMELGSYTHNNNNTRFNAAAITVIYLWICTSMYLHITIFVLTIIIQFQLSFSVSVAIAVGYNSLSVYVVLNLFQTHALCAYFMLFLIYCTYTFIYIYFKHLCCLLKTLLYQCRIQPWAHNERAR